MTFQIFVFISCNCFYRVLIPLPKCDGYLTVSHFSTVLCTFIDKSTVCVGRAGSAPQYLLLHTHRWSDRSCSPSGLSSFWSSVGNMVLLGQGKVLTPRQLKGLSQASPSTVGFWFLPGTLLGSGHGGESLFSTWAGACHPCRRRPLSLVDILKIFVIILPKLKQKNTFLNPHFYSFCTWIYLFNLIYNKVWVSGDPPKH